ncbi:hypothetical protein IAR50_006548 [Cryptococcus sp. DSM 104548]
MSSHWRYEWTLSFDFHSRLASSLLHDSYRPFAPATPFGATAPVSALTHLTSILALTSVEAVSSPTVLTLAPSRDDRQHHYRPRHPSSHRHRSAPPGRGGLTAFAPPAPTLLSRTSTAFPNSSTPRTFATASSSATTATTYSLSPPSTSPSLSPASLGEYIVSHGHEFESFTDAGVLVLRGHPEKPGYTLALSWSIMVHPGGGVSHPSPSCMFTGTLTWF